MKHTKSLSFVVSAWSAMAIAACMAVYAVFQYFRIPGITATGLFLHHLWHVLLLGLVIYMLCWLVFRRVLMKPLDQIYVHLYGIGTGRVHELELSTSVTEIRTIVDGINLMLRRMTVGTEGECVKNAQQQTAQLRKLVKKLPTEESDATMAFLDQLAELDKSLLSIVQNRPDHNQSDGRIASRG